MLLKVPLLQGQISVSSDKDTKPCKQTSVSAVVLAPGILVHGSGDEIPAHPRGRAPLGVTLGLCSRGRKIPELYCGSV